MISFLYEWIGPEQPCRDGALAKLCSSATSFLTTTFLKKLVNFHFLFCSIWSCSESKTRLEQQISGVKSKTPLPTFIKLFQTQCVDSVCKERSTTPFSSWGNCIVSDFSDRVLHPWYSCSYCNTLETPKLQPLSCTLREQWLLRQS